MANVLSTQILVDGARNAVVKITGQIDASDIAKTTIVDPADFTPLPTNFRIDRIVYSVEQGIAVLLWWDASTDVLIVSLTQSETQKYAKIGGLQNNAGAGVTGKIQLSTVGWAASAVYSFSLTLDLVKIGV